LTKFEQKPQILCNTEVLIFTIFHYTIVIQASIVISQSHYLILEFFCVLCKVNCLFKWNETEKFYVSFHLTLCRPVYEYVIPGFQPKTSRFRSPYRHLSSFADCPRELFKGSNGLAVFSSALEKIFLIGGCGFFINDVVSEIVFGPFLLILPGLGPNR